MSARRQAWRERIKKIKLEQSELKLQIDTIEHWKASIKYFEVGSDWPFAAAQPGKETTFLD